MATRNAAKARNKSNEEDVRRWAIEHPQEAAALAARHRVSGAAAAASQFHQSAFAAGRQEAVAAARKLRPTPAPYSVRPPAPHSGSVGTSPGLASKPTTQRPPLAAPPAAATGSATASMTSRPPQPTLTAPPAAGTGLVTPQPTLAAPKTVAASAASSATAGFKAGSGPTSTEKPPPFKNVRPPTPASYLLSTLGGNSLQGAAPKRQQKPTNPRKRVVRPQSSKKGGYSSSSSGVGRPPPSKSFVFGTGSDTVSASGADDEMLSSGLDDDDFLHYEMEVDPRDLVPRGEILQESAAAVVPIPVATHAADMAERRNLSQFPVSCATVSIPSVSIVTTSVTTGRIVTSATASCHASPVFSAPKLTVAPSGPASKLATSTTAATPTTAAGSAMAGSMTTVCSAPPSILAAPKLPVASSQQSATPAAPQQLTQQPTQARPLYSEAAGQKQPITIVAYKLREVSQPFESEEEWLEMKNCLDKAILEQWANLGHRGAWELSYDRSVFNYGRGKIFCGSEAQRDRIVALMLQLGMEKHIAVPKHMLPKRDEPRRIILQFEKIELYPGPTTAFLDHLRAKHNINSDLRIITEGPVNLHGKISTVVTISVTPTVATYISQQGFSLTGPIGQIKFFGRQVSRERRRLQAESLPEEEPSTSGQAPSGASGQVPTGASGRPPSDTSGQAPSGASGQAEVMVPTGISGDLKRTSEEQAQWKEGRLQSALKLLSDNGISTDGLSTSQIFHRVRKFHKDQRFEHAMKASANKQTSMPPADKQDN